MRPSRPRLRVLYPLLGWRLGLVLLVGLSACGSPSPDPPVLGHSTGSADAVASPPASDAPSAGPAAPQAPKPGTLITDTSRATSPAQDARAQTAVSPANKQQPDEQTKAEQTQQEARQIWFAEMREHPDVTVRLQALEVWAQQPGDTLDPVTYALVDEDEHVRARAQELWEQQLTRDAAATQPVQEERHGEQAER